MFGYVSKKVMQDLLQDLRLERDNIIKGAHTCDLTRRVEVHLEIRMIKKLMKL